MRAISSAVRHAGRSGFSPSRTGANLHPDRTAPCDDRRAYVSGNAAAGPPFTDHRETPDHAVQAATYRISEDRARPLWYTQVPPSMNSFERTTLEAFLEKHLARQERTSFHVATLAAQGWDIGLLTELAVAYARTPSAERRFDIEFLNHATEAQLVFKRHAAVVA